jgi:hypothetical protein
MDALKNSKKISLLAVAILFLFTFFKLILNALSIRQMNFQYIFSNFEKFKSFVETFTPLNQILIFEEQLWLSNMDFYI